MISLVPTMIGSCSLENLEENMDGDLYFLRRSKRLVVRASEGTEVIFLLPATERLVIEWKNPNWQGFFSSDYLDYLEVDEHFYVEFGLDLFVSGQDAWVYKKGFENPGGISFCSVWCLTFEDGRLYRKLDFSFELFWGDCAFCLEDAARKIQLIPGILRRGLSKVIVQ